MERVRMINMDDKSNENIEEKEFSKDNMNVNKSQNNNSDKSGNSNNRYSANEIRILTGLEAVRKRPGMYIGSTDIRGLNHLIYEIVDNSIDEMTMGFCDSIEVIIHKDNSVTISDNGRGIPVDIHPKLKVSAAEIVVTKLHAGGKFDKKVYKISGGLHGVGLSVVNALSKWLKLEIKRDGKIWELRCERGKIVEHIHEIGKTDETGTTVSFMPDDTIFETVSFDKSTIESRLRELAFLNKGAKIEFKDERTGSRELFFYENGLKDFLEYFNEGKTPINEPILLSKKVDDVELEIGIQFSTSYTRNVISFVNNIKTIEGGTHITGFKSAITRTVNNYIAKNQKKFKVNIKLTYDDISEGMTAIIVLKVAEPQFEGQTKTRLGNSNVKGIVESIVNERLAIYLEEHPKEAAEIISKSLNSAKAREAAKRARELIRRKSALESTSLPGKLSDCSSKDMTKSEIFIVEGESAGGSAKQGRSREFQAILPLRGKILNVEKARINKIFSNEELTNMITALGTNIKENFDSSKLRYNKVIIMTDADVDGAHIRTLLLTFFFRYLKPLIEEGHVYIAQPPLYKVSKNKNVVYLYTDDELDKIKKEWGDDVNIQRYKGLGEMNPSQLWETTMNPETRSLVRVTINDAIKADHIFNILMGQDVKSRREFIEQHAKEVVNLDI